MRLPAPDWINHIWHASRVMTSFVEDYPAKPPPADECNYTQLFMFDVWTSVRIFLPVNPAGNFYY